MPLEHIFRLIDQDDQEIEFAVDVYLATPFVTEQRSGSPDNWCPAEGGDVEIDHQSIRFRRVEDPSGAWQLKSYDDLIGALELSLGCSDSRSASSFEAAEEYANSTVLDAYTAMELERQNDDAMDRAQGFADEKME